MPDKNNSCHNAIIIHEQSKIMSDVIWLVEDEAAIADTLIYTLEKENYSVSWFNQGAMALEALKSSKPDLAILDVGLPDINGFDLSRKMTAQHAIPFVFLTARSEELDRIVGLELGADDYIAKPFSPRELAVRVRNILRRVDKGTQVSSDKPVSFGAFELNESCASVTYFSQSLLLTRYEYLLLKTLLLSPGRVFSRQLLMDMLWVEENSTDRTIDTHIKTIRAKLKVIAPEFEPIQTHRGLGYSLSAQSCV